MPLQNIVNSWKCWALTWVHIEWDCMCFKVGSIGHLKITDLPFNKLWTPFKLFISSLIPIDNFSPFAVQRACTVFIKIIPRSLVIFEVVVNGIYNQFNLLIICCWHLEIQLQLIFIMYLTILLNSLINSNI